MPKHEPERTCIFCRKKGTKDNFYKLVLKKDGEIVVCNNNNIDGRGLYICKNRDCISGMVKAKSLSRVLKRNIAQSVYREIESELNKFEC